MQPNVTRSADVVSFRVCRRAAVVAHAAETDNPTPSFERMKEQRQGRRAAARKTFFASLFPLTTARRRPKKGHPNPQKARRAIRLAVGAWPVGSGDSG
ncbi:hypothetical protein psal_cds_892 [Pandoravirus salinus]|uniref:Uncharacterized protein n=1 Tax=Pandoravirus salinus TaxID=1349410 RepID=S4VZQ5_9VIRU|nr:hypothetical protein psal_cds_892 [Pandoravirus salinus]AGO84981.2 hypothetical protein psal_cds_892 [Pandoravirus salinus]